MSMEKENLESPLINGFTGESGRDGILTPEQQALLDRIQNEAAQVALNAIEFRKEGQPFPLEAMATGIGKTKIEHIIIENWTRKKPGSKVLFIAGTKQVLVSQSSEALAKYQKKDALDSYAEAENLEEDTEETEDLEEFLKIEKQDLPQYKVGKFGDKDADVQVATIQMIQSAFKKGTLNPDEFDLVIVDEAHNVGTPTREPIISSFKNVVGFTATPVRSSGKSKLPQQYGFENIYSLSLPEAQEERLLPPLLGMQIDTSKLADFIPTTQSGQINFKELEKMLKKNPDLRPFIADKIADIIKSGDKEYKTVIVVNFVWEAQELAELLKNKGIKVGVAVNQQAAKVIHSDEVPALGSIDRYKMPAENMESIQVLISPYVASEGFDAPFTEVLVWASPTDSDLRYTQYTGRLARRASGKAFGLVIDCLFQTSQYGWNYNFAMWMKGNVKQMPNGLLYLGPEQDIEGLNELEAVKNMRQKADVFNASELENKGLEELKDTDFSLSNKNLINIFIGGIRKIRPTADEIIADLKHSNPEYFVKRKSYSAVVEVIVSTEVKTVFLNRMKAKGFKLKNLVEKLKNEDFSLAIENLEGVFFGDYKKIRKVAKEVILKFKQSHPEYLAERKSGRVNIDVIISSEGRQYFFDEMKANGVELKDDVELKDEDFPLTQENLNKTFFGEKIKIYKIAEEIISNLKQLRPEYFSKKKSGVHSIDVITSSEGKKLFISEMQTNGIELNKEEIKNTDFSLAVRDMQKVFSGGQTRIVQTAAVVIEKLKQSYPEVFVVRKIGNKNINVIISPEGKQAFIDAMLHAGLKLKDKSK